MQFLQISCLKNPLFRHPTSLLFVMCLGWEKICPLAYVSPIKRQKEVVVGFDYNTVGVHQSLSLGKYKEGHKILPFVRTDIGCSL